jgi:hypothetical protein
MTVEGEASATSVTAVSVPACIASPCQAAEGWEKRCKTFGVCVCVTPRQDTALGAAADGDAKGDKAKKKKSKKGDKSRETAAGGSAGAGAVAAAASAGAGPGAVSIAELGVPLPEEARPWCHRVADAVEKADLTSSSMDERPTLGIPMWRPVRRCVGAGMWGCLGVHPCMASLAAL